jgi:hypothetical protein
VGIEFPIDRPERQGGISKPLLQGRQQLDVISVFAKSSTTTAGKGNEAYHQFLFFLY